MATTTIAPVEFCFDGRSIGARLELEVVDLSLPFDAVRDDLLDESVNMYAGYAASAIAWSTRPIIEAAVYVAGKLYTTGCKVGTSSNPIDRLRPMQSNTAPDLFLAALFWTIGDTPFALERMSINEAGSRGKRFHGEWLSMDPESAAEMIYQRAQDRGVAFATSWMHLRNMERIARQEHELHFDYLLREWGKQRAFTWRTNNPLAPPRYLCQ